MDHYTPAHPLPEEIQAMKRDETVCQFCGVSYLIHNEIKALELKLEKAENELKELRGQEIREAKLKESLAMSKKEANLYQAQLSERDNLVSMLQTGKEKTESMLHQCQLDINTLKEALSSSEGSHNKVKEDNFHLRQVLEKLVVYLKQSKQTIQAVKSDVATLENETKTLVENGFNTFIANIDAVNRATMERYTIELKKEKAVTLELTEQLEQAQKEMKTLNKQLMQTTDQRNEAAKQVDVLKNESKDLENKHKNIVSDMESINVILNKKTKEYESLLSQSKSSKTHYEREIQILNEELAATQSEYKRIRFKFEELEEEKDSVRQLQAEQDRAAARSKDESDAMRSKLEQTLNDLEALKLEREQMITAHHNRIDDLRESFKHKMLEADKWPEKMEAALQRERKKHASELAALEQALKEGFVSEVEIEKQKSQQLLELNTSDLKAQVRKLKAQLQDHTSSQSEIESLKQQLKTAKADAQGTEARLRSEIQSLKSIISNLESRLGKLDTGNHELIAKLKSDISAKDISLEESEENVKSLSKEISELQNQVKILQDTVSRECEERMELIEALGEAREQLLLLKRPAGGYNSRNSSPKVSQQVARGASERKSTTSNSRSSTHSEEMVIFRRSSQSSQSKPDDSGESSQSDAALNPNVKNIDFKGENSKPKPLQALRALDSHQKKKLAAILSRDKN